MLKKFGIFAILFSILFFFQSTLAYELIFLNATDIYFCFSAVSCDVTRIRSSDDIRQDLTLDGESYVEMRSMHNGTIPYSTTINNVTICYEGYQDTMGTSCHLKIGYINETGGKVWKYASTSCEDFGLGSDEKRCWSYDTDNLPLSEFINASEEANKALADIYIMGADLHVDQIYILVNYTLLGNLSVNLIEPANGAEIKLNVPFNISGKVSCIGGPCGNVTLYIEWYTDGKNYVFPLPPCESLPMDDGDECNFFWDGATLPWTGVWTVRMFANSTFKRVEDSFSATHTVYVVPGELSITLDKPVDGTKIVLGGNFTLDATISCLEADCGNVSAYAQFCKGEGCIQFGNMGVAGALSTFSPNPFDCGAMMLHSICRPSWKVDVNEDGRYEVRVYADSDIATDVVSLSSTVIVYEAFGLALTSPLEGDEFSWGDELLIETKLTTDEEPALGASAIAEINFTNPVKINLYDDGKHNDSEANDGIYANVFKIPSGEEGKFELKVSATYEDSSAEEKVNITIKSLLLVSLRTDNLTYSIGMNIEINGSITSLKGVPKANLTVFLLLSYGDWGFSSQVRTDSRGRFSYIYETTYADPKGMWEIEASAKDDYLNEGKSEVRVEVKIPRELAWYAVQFFTPTPGLEYTRGEEIIISVGVVRGTELVTGATVKVRTPTGKLITLKETEEPGIYSAKYLIPLDEPLGKWSVAVESSKLVGATTYGGGGFLNVYIKPATLTLTVLDPKEVLFKTGDLVKFTIAVHYPDGTPVEHGNVTINDPWGRIIKLEERERATYVGYYKVTPEDKGTWIINIKATDIFGNTGSERKGITLKYVRPFVLPIEQIFALVAIIIVGLFITFMMGRRVVFQKQLARLQARKKRLVEMKRITQDKYFDRKIDEETYLKLMREHEAELVEVQSKIDELQRVFKKRKPKKKKR